MSTVLGHNQYGKSSNRLVVVRRDDSVHELRDLMVSVALAGDLADTHLTGDNANVLPTDTQKNTVYAFARRYGVDHIEDFALLLARHFVDSQPSIHRARVSIEEYAWRRLGPHSFGRGEPGVASVVATYDGSRAWLVGGVHEMVLLNTTNSEFHGFIVDEYTTLEPATDRILATVVRADWRYATIDASELMVGRSPAPPAPGTAIDWAARRGAATTALVETFVAARSLSLQQTLYAMGRAVLVAEPGIVEVRLSLPNRHHFLVDLSPFDLDNPGLVFFPADRPYGLIEASVLRTEADDPGYAWTLSAAA